MSFGDRWRETDSRKKIASFIILAVCVGLALRLPGFVPGAAKVAVAAAALALFAGFLLYGIFKGKKKEVRKQQSALRVIKGGMAHIPKPKKEDVERALGKKKRKRGRE